MLKYYTQYFENTSDIAEKIDSFLISFEIENKCAAEGNHADIEGYQVLGDKLIITVSRWENNK